MAKRKGSREYSTGSTDTHSQSLLIPVNSGPAPLQSSNQDVRQRKSSTSPSSPVLEHERGKGHQHSSSGGAQEGVSTGGTNSSHGGRSFSGHVNMAQGQFNPYANPASQ